MGLTTAQRKILGQRSIRVSYLQITAAGRKAIAGGARASRSCAPVNASVEESGLFVVVGSPHQHDRHRKLAPFKIHVVRTAI
jgi:hypothetical protein